MCKINDDLGNNREIDMDVDLDKPKKKKRFFKGTFFNRMDYLAFGISFLISFIVYFLTTAPSVTLEDSGELAVAGDYLGVPHPPGYPLWTMCAYVFTRIFSFVTYMGQPNPAWAIGLMSGFFGALAAGIMAMLINKCAKQLVLHATDDGTSKINVPSYIPTTTCLVSAISGSLAFAFSPVEWSQSTIIEVYTLNSFFLMLIFLFIFKWLCKPSVKLLWLVAFLFGLGFTNYQVLLFMAVPMVIAVLLYNISLFRDFVLLFIPLALTIKMMELGAKFPEPGFPKLFAQSLEGEVPSVGGNVPESLPIFYAIVTILCLLLCILAILRTSRLYTILEKKIKGDNIIAKWMFFAGFIILAIIAIVVASFVPEIQPIDDSSANDPNRFSFNTIYLLYFVAILVLFGFGASFKGGLWYAGAVTVTQLTLLIFMRNGCMLGLTHPLSGYFWFYIGLNVLYLLMAWLMLPNGRAVAGTVFFAELGASFYFYMPLASETNPPMNWGYPKTWEGFKHAVSRGQYEKIVPITLSQVLSPNFVRQLGSYFSDLRMQFTLVLAPLGFIPFALWSIKVKGKRFCVFPVAFGLAAAIALLAALDKVIDPTSANDLGGAYKYLMGLILLMATVGFALMLCRIEHLLFDEVRDKAKDIYTRIITGLCLAGVIASVLGVIVCVSNIGAEYIVEVGFGISEPVVGVPSGAEAAKYRRVSIALTVVISLLFIAIYALMSVFSYKKKDFIKTDHSDVSCKWFIITLVAFLMMSVVLIGMANPRGDIQDNFIQKVKFISSHAIFAIWIGYGIALSINFFRNIKPIWVIGVVASALLFIIPIRENYLNADMADITSAAEQNGHDFGWQFGNYQLRGANAINEELSIDEEPLPNPEYPPEMTTNAVFFGGTDPGRFVPTYMIYSAKVRPDVFLITQNALADPTYMDTMRSLYADQIWMPTAYDNSNAFSEYIRLVRTGVLPNLGGISEKGGRTQVNGAMEVMEINAIITKQIFDKNIEKHDFYVEESYAMRWMNPYLTPHGLIMKINAEQQSPQQFNDYVQNDMDFWDWYTRRLTSNEGYERDVAARRAFSKLRASLAGLYATRAMNQTAERAFIDGIILYPYSPECTIRYMREVLYPSGRLDDSILYVEKLLYKDKNNAQANAALDTLKEIKNARDVIVNLSKKSQNTPLSSEELLQMVKAANVTGNISVRSWAFNSFFNSFNSENIDDYKIAEEMLLQMVGYQGVDTNTYKLVNKLPEDFFDNVEVETIRMGADAYMRAGNLQRAMNCLSKIISKDPNDWRSWSSYSLLLLQTTKKPNVALQYLEKGEQAAIKVGEYKQFNELIMSVGELTWLYGNLINKRQSTIYNSYSLPPGIMR